MKKLAFGLVLFTVSFINTTFASAEIYSFYKLPNSKVICLAADDQRVMKNMSGSLTKAVSIIMHNALPILLGSSRDYDGLEAKFKSDMRIIHGIAFFPRTVDDEHFSIFSDDFGFIIDDLDSGMRMLVAGMMITSK